MYTTGVARLTEEAQECVLSLENLTSHLTFKKKFQKHDVFFKCGAGNVEFRKRA